MRAAYILSLFLFFAVPRSTAQNNYQYWYNSTFALGENGLRVLDTTGVKGYVQDGAYHIETDEYERAFTFGIKAELDAEDDFIFRAGVRCEEKSENFFGIGAGLKNARNGLFFVISRSGYYSIYFNEGGRPREISSSSTSVIKADNYNDLMIMKSGKWMYCYINFELHASFPYEPGMGTAYALAQFGKQHTACDYFYLKEKITGPLITPPAEPETKGIEIIGSVVDISTKTAVPARVRYRSLGSHGPWRSVPTQQNGSFTIRLKGNEQIELAASKRGFYGEPLSVKVEPGEKTPHLTLQLHPLNTGKRIVIENLVFEISKPALKQQSIPELERVKFLLLSNPTIKIEIGGHTSVNTSPPSYNQDLSEKRAATVREFLIRAGVDGSRITAKGYGNSMPLDKRSGEEHQEKNRRVEIMVLEL